MNQKKIIFWEIEDIIDFVRKAEKYVYNIEMQRGDVVVDAKSLLGLMNLGLEQELVLHVQESACEDFMKAIEKYCIN